MTSTATGTIRSRHVNRSGYLFTRPYSQGPCLKSINAIGRQLAQKRGVKINSFLFDDGWDNRNSIWRFNSGFPHGFAPLAQVAAKYGAHIGVWLSPFGGYGSARDQRIAYAKAHGYEVDSGGLSISGPKYYHRFAAVCMHMIHRYGVNVFKFDGLAAGARAASAGQTLDGDAMLRLIRTLRLAEPRVYINQTTGTWPSPFWLLNVDSTWRGGGDHAFIGAGSWCQKWINYRDAEVYANVVKRAPLYPLNSLMVHGIIYARLTRRLHSMSDRGFADQVWSYFGSGTQLQELYITPSLLDKNNWNVLAIAAKGA
ncbi:MAG: enterotoxin, partial [Phycisphaerae bacterium]